MESTTTRTVIKSYILVGLLIFLPLQSAAETEPLDKSYPQISDTFSYVYDDYLIAYDRVFTEEAIPYWWAVGLSTVALVAVDDKLIDSAQNLGRQWGIASDDKTSAVIELKGKAILRAPHDLGSALYFIGDGWTHTAIAAGFLATGAWTENDKTFSVGYQIIEGMITTTIATQTIKHITGRESPTHTTTPTGRWDLFPNQRDYFECVPCFDAFPSGHVSVSTMTLTVLHKNYPDNPWIMPVGITLLTALSFQMMNNEVHWASDYPLAIAFGYTFGSIAYERGQRALARNEEVNTARWVPIVDDGKFGLGMHYQF